MDNSLQSTHFAEDGHGTLLESVYETDEHTEGEEHVHLPNPSYWPLILGSALLLAFAGLLFINNTPWILLVAVLLVFIGIIGWALEDPMAKIKETFMTVPQQPVDPYPYKIGQQVVDKEGQWLGKVEARFPHHILVEQGGFLSKVYYVPWGMVKQTTKNNVIVLSASEEELQAQGLNSIPDNLYEEAPEYGVPVTTGVAQVARRPLSPAETGHYNYGRRGPGMNTDASGSYHRSDVVQHPQTVVIEATP